MRTRTTLLGVSLAASILATAGCATAETPLDAAESGALQESDVQETDARQTRLLIADAVTGSVLVVDGATGDPVSTLDLGAPGSLYPLEGGRYALSVQTADNLVRLVDAGVWEDSHGDHSHYYATTPEVLPGELEGPTPVHVTQFGDLATVFMDGDGSTRTIDLDALDEGLIASTGATADPHHGVAYQLADGGVVASFSGADGRAAGVRVTDAAGAIVTETAECPGLHGETELGALLIFACADGIVTLDTLADTVVKTAYGVEGRTGTLVANDGETAAYGIVAGTTLLTFDGAAVTTAALPGFAIGLAVAEDGDAIVILADGTVARVSTTGAVLASAPLGSAFDPQSDHSVPRPAVRIDGETVYLSDPATGLVTIADSATLDVLREVTVGFTPKSIAIIG
jgi:hypothetical protein